MKKCGERYTNLVPLYALMMYGFSKSFKNAPYNWNKEAKFIDKRQYKRFEAAVLRGHYKVRSEIEAAKTKEV